MTCHNQSFACQGSSQSSDRKDVLRGTHSGTRTATQVESLTEQFKLGIHRLSPDRRSPQKHPGAHSKGSAGSVTIKNGVICAHIINTFRRALCGLKIIHSRVRILGDRELIFGDVIA
jgi:hypothetical protein